VADAPNFERYGESFDPVTGNGGLEIWVPVKEEGGVGGFRRAEFSISLDRAVEFPLPGTRSRSK
jgi:hypothetical protein